MSSTKYTKRQREEKINELMSLHEALPEWTIEEIVRSALIADDIPIRLHLPRAEEFDYSDEQYRRERQERRSSKAKLASMPWKFAIGFALLGGVGSYFAENLRPYFFAVGLVGLIVGAVVGSLYKSLRWKTLSQKYTVLDRFEKELFAFVYWSKRRAVEFWQSLSGLAFEQELARVFRISGYDAIVTHASGDEGVDIILRKDSKTGVVQCKAHKKPIGPNVVRELFGSAVHFGADFIMLAATSGFTPAAIQFANQKSILLLEISDIIKMQELASSDSLNDQRIVYFPNNLSFGEIYIREREAGKGELTEFAAATGRVVLPNDKTIHLRVENTDHENELFPDLSPLDKLKPNDIQELDLLSIFLESPLLKHIGRLEGLEWLRLRGDDLTDDSFQYISQLKNLSVLIIDFGKFSGAGISHLLRLRHLRELELNGIIDFTDKGLECISRLVGLTRLSLQLLELTPKGLGNLARLPNLQVLSLGPFVEIDEDISIELTKLKALKILEVGDLEEECLDRLRRMLPKCQIIDTLINDPSPMPEMSRDRDNDS